MRPYKRLTIKDKATGKFTDIAAIFKGERGDFFSFDRNIAAIKLADGTVIQVSSNSKEQAFYCNVQDADRGRQQGKAPPSSDDDFGF